MFSTDAFALTDNKGEKGRRNYAGAYLLGSGGQVWTDGLYTVTCCHPYCSPAAAVYDPVMYYIIPLYVMTSPHVGTLA